MHGINVHGALIDKQTRCKHYDKPIDIIAIKFKCCETYYPCYKCHAEEADHQAKVWGREEFDHKAILCGKCGEELTINEYLNSNSSCSCCNASFNPGCQKHKYLYFEGNN
ncbi:CHY zinc finger protein [Paraliobacillus quinghaiensis]|uniref:CHY zinc finger protein n=1 Tax=Paraliobacillus quinghaiensis TaxID=470815 RepID=UPI00357100B4